MDMQNLLLLVLCCCPLLIQAEGGEMTLEEALRRGGKQGKRPKKRDETLECVIDKPSDQCVDPDRKRPPFCLETKCMFTPKYGEEITSVWQQFDLPFYQRERKYRKIIDLGGDFTTSFPAKVCKNTHVVCGCKGACKCDKEDDVHVCKQKYTEELQMYLVFNKYFCRPPMNPFLNYILQAMGGKGGGFNPFLFSLFAKKDEDDSDRRHYTPPKKPYVPPTYHQVPPYHTSQPQSPSQNSFFYYLLASKFMKPGMMGGADPDSFVPCGMYKEQNKGYGGQHYNPVHHQPDHYSVGIFGSQYNMNAMVKYAFLKVKVPDGCECEEM